MLGKGALQASKSGNTEEIESASFLEMSQPPVVQLGGLEIGASD